MYVPYDSARIQVNYNSQNDKDRISCAKFKMAEFLMKKLEKLPILIRLNINFRINVNNFNSFSGKTQHCLPIEIVEIMKFIIFRYKMFFS